MVSKILKREFLYYGKSLLLFEGILLCMAILGRVLTSFEPNDTVMEMLQVSLILITFFGCFACIIMAFVMILTRFYKNLFTAEGYLMFTLPVTEAQHIFAKLIAAVLAMLSACVTAVAYFLILFSRDNMLQELWWELSYAFDIAFIEVGWHFYAYILEVILLVIIAMLSVFLFYYMCIALGQVLKIKNRILGAVLVYFAFNVAGQIVSPIFTDVFMNVYIENIDTWMTLHPIESIHVGLIAMIVWYALTAAVYFLVTHYIMRHKLNLE